ncbi:hypothetical protein Ddc_22457 [Ditylenchus destructor]|nr:hypothetical protein Ddc_22457 [Ditylenchus destructor]
MTQFEQHNSPNKIHKNGLQQKEYGCKNQYNRLVPRIYADRFCQYGHMIYYKNSNVVKSMKILNYTVEREFIEFLDKDLKSSFFAQWNTTIKTGCLNDSVFMLIIHRNITQIERVKSNATLDVKYGVEVCNFDGLYDDAPCKDQRNLSIIQDFDMDQIVCCRTLFNDSTVIYDPITRLASRVNNILFAKKPDAATVELSNILKWGMHECVYYRDGDNGTCYFYYHKASRKVLTVEEGTNFVYVANISLNDILSDVDEYYVSVNETENAKECRCFSIGGCETNNINYDCNSIDKTFLLCSCKTNDDYYADYKLYLELKEGRPSAYIYVPYCFVKAANGTTTINQSLDAFFCYESYRPPKGWDRKYHSYNSEKGFYNDASEKAPLKFKDCLHKESQCKLDESGMYICCCRAIFGGVQPLPVSFCNDGSMIERFVRSETMQNPKQFVVTARERELCDDAMKNDVLKSNLLIKSLSAEPSPLCFFSIKFSNKSADLDDVKSVYYSSTNKTRRDNIGMFSLLCMVEKWTPQEHANGCACRLIEPLLPKFRKRKFVAEVSCCCIATQANYFKQFAMDIIKKRFAPYTARKR